ncbi:oligosaccharide flippase family protein [Hyphomonas sp.]|uniref:oligosaccharide flippase family protein n=1 Tax=Hyphomonas sp. TaxID=87 RepID=UPI003527D729
MLWNLVGFIFFQGAGFFIFLIMAMRLPPEIFGIVALATVFGDIIAIDGRYACMDAVIQAGKFDKRGLNTSFAGFMLFTLLFTLSLVAVGFFIGHQPGYELLGTFFPVIGLLLLPVPWLAIMDALMMRDLEFKQLTQRSILSTFVGGIAGIAVAFSPWLVWALIVQRVVALLTAAIFEYQHTRWFPGSNIEWINVFPFLKRFFPLWIISSLNQIAPRATVIVFGVRYDTATVGLLRAANRIGETLQGPIVSPMMGLWFPLMSKARQNKAEEREIYTSIIRTAAFLALPAFAGMSIVAPDLVALFLPESYEGVGPLLQAISVVSLMIPIAWFNAIAMASLDMNRPSLTFTIVNVAICVGTLIALTNVSPAVAVVGMSAPSFFLSFIGNAIIHRRIELPAREHYLGLFPAVSATLIMVLTVYGFYTLAATWSPALRVALSVLIGAPVYLGWIFILHRRWLIERLDLVRNRNKNG